MCCVKKRLERLSQLSEKFETELQTFMREFRSFSVLSFSAVQRNNVPTTTALASGSSRKRKTMRTNLMPTTDMDRIQVYLILSASCCNFVLHLFANSS